MGSLVFNRAGLPIRSYGDPGWLGGRPPEPPKPKVVNNTYRYPQGKIRIRRVKDAVFRAFAETGNGECFGLWLNLSCDFEGD